MASETGRELAYQHWGHDDLAKAMVQAENEIKALEREMALVQEERDQFYEESRWSAQQLGGIIRILRDSGTDIDEPAAPAASGRVPRQRGGAVSMRHFNVGGDGLGGHVCNCGAQWLVGGSRCVTDGPSL